MWTLSADVQHWETLVADPEIGVPAVSNVEVATWEDKTLVYVGEGPNCEKRATIIGSPISALYTAVFRGNLVTVARDGTQSTQDVAIKRGRGNSGELVLYGGSVQKQFSNNGNILPVIDYLVAGRYKYLIMPWVNGGDRPRVIKKESFLCFLLLRLSEIFRHSPSPPIDQPSRHCLTKPSKPRKSCKKLSNPSSVGMSVSQET